MNDDTLKDWHYWCEQTIRERNSNKELKRENKRLREALQKIVDSEYQDAGGYGKFHARIARQALEKPTND